MKTVLFSFPDDVTRDKYLTIMKTLSENTGDAATASLIISTLGTARLNVAIKEDHERTAAVYVSGQKLLEGLLPAMRTRYQQEIGAHSANVELRELRGGEWVVIQSRRNQQRR